MKKITPNVYLADVYEPNKPAIIEGSSLIAVDPGSDNPEDARSALNQIKALSDALNKPVSHVIITHTHPDHSANTPHYVHAFRPEIIAHQNCPMEFSNMNRISDEIKTSIADMDIHIIPSPGHSDIDDDISIFVDEDKLLFCGDLAQPQGRDYHQASAYSPVPFFCDGDKYLDTLGRLLELPIEYLLTGHGSVLKGYAAPHALDLTMTVLLRMRSLAEKLVGEHQEIPALTICEWIFDTIAWERKFEKKLAEKRKTLKQNNGRTRYEEFDLPGIEYFVKKARAEQPASKAMAHGKELWK